MSGRSPQEVTQLLPASRCGDQSALNELILLIHSELHRLAYHYMLGERPGYALQTTPLVNEAHVTVKLRYFGGLTEEETGEVLGISTRTIKRDSAVAKVRFRRETESAGGA